MFASIVDKFKEITQPVSAQRPQDFPECNDNDIEEDGFLVLGQTRSDREAINSGTFDPHSVDGPPTYNQVMTPPVLSNHHPVFLATPQTTVPSGGGQKLLTPISDVPFQLAPSLAILRDFQENSADSFICDTRLKIFNWSQYEYDFSVEESVSREYCSEGSDFNINGLKYY